MEKPHHAAPDTVVLPTFHPVPGIGVLPVNAFVIKAKEPVLVDTGLGEDRGKFMEALESILDPRELKWIWLSHDDSDHTGSLRDVLAAAPDARLIVNFIGASRMGADWPVPMDRVYFLNPGETIDAGDRTLTAFRPPLYDAPGVNGIYDDKSKAFFSIDSFGAIIPAGVEDAADVPKDDLARGFHIWHSIDQPWLHIVDQDKFADVLNRVRELEPETILSSHLPPASDMNDEFLKLMQALPDSEPFVGPNQADLEAMLAQMTQRPG